MAVKDCDPLLTPATRERHEHRGCSGVGTPFRQIFWSQNGAPANIIGHRWNANTDAFPQITLYSLGWTSIGPPQWEGATPSCTYPQHGYMPCVGVQAPPLLGPRSRKLFPQIKIYHGWAPWDESLVTNWLPVVTYFISSLAGIQLSCVTPQKHNSAADLEFLENRFVIAVIRLCGRLCSTIRWLYLHHKDNVLRNTKD